MNLCPRGRKRGKKPNRPKQIFHRKSSEIVGLLATHQAIQQGKGKHTDDGKELQRCGKQGVSMNLIFYKSSFEKKKNSTSVICSPEISTVHHHKSKADSSGDLSIDPRGHGGQGKP